MAITIYQQTTGKTTRDRKLRASNRSVLNADWSGCGPQNISATFTATSNSKKPNILTYRLTVQNLAEENMSANITATLPQNVRFINSTIRPTQISADRISWEIGKLISESRRTISFVGEAVQDGLFTSWANIHGSSLDGRDIGSINVSAPLVLGNLANVSGAYSSDWLPCEGTEEMLGPNSWNETMISSEAALPCLCTS
jgi:hypothetical protein